MAKSHQSLGSLACWSCCFLLRIAALTSRVARMISIEAGLLTLFPPQAPSRQKYYGQWMLCLR